MKLKNKIISAFIALLIALVPAFSFFSSAEETTVTVTPLFGGFENWVNSPSYPNPGKAPGVTELLVGVTDKDGNFIESLNDKTLVYSLTFSYLENGKAVSKTISLSPSTVAANYKLIRFEPCEGDSDNRFIPYKNQSYTLSLSVEKDGITYKGQSANGAFTCPMFPVVDGAIDESREYIESGASYPYEVEIKQYHSGTYEKDGETLFESDWEIWKEKSTLIVLISKDEMYNVSDIKAGTAVNAVIGNKGSFDLRVDSIYNFTNDLLVRIPTQDVFMPENGKTYNVTLSFYADDNKNVTYAGSGSGFTGDGVPTSPQTGDGAIAWCLAALISVGAMAFILAPKKRHGA